MNIWKRAWVSITRRKVNSMVLLLIVFILANVLLTTLTVTTSLKNTKQMMLEQFAPSVTVGYSENYDSIEGQKLTAEMADSLYDKTQDILKSYDYSLSMHMERNIDIKNPDIRLDEEMEEITKNVLANIMLKGTQLPSTNLVAKDEAKLISGTGFSDIDIKEGKPKAIVSKQFAEANGFVVGSKFPISRILYSFNKEEKKFGDPFFSEDLELEIVGIMEVTMVDEFIKKQVADPTDDPNKVISILIIASTIYVPNSFISPLIKDNMVQAQEYYQEEKIDVPGVSQNTSVYPEFILKDMKYLNDFETEAKKIYNEKDFTITSAASQYEIVAAPLNSMENLLDIVFIITIIASIAVLTLVLHIFMYLRQKEMGVFLALGERHVNIIGQVLIETLIVALIGATLAIFTSIIFSNILSDNTIQSLLTSSNEMTNITYMSASSGLTPEAISEHVQGGFGFTTFLIFYITMIITIFISQVATILYLLRLNPKKILM